MNIISIITINITDGSKRHHEIDYDLKDSRIWLSRHCMWAMHNNSAVLALPRDGANEIYIGHADDVSDIDTAANI